MAEDLDDYVFDLDESDISPEEQALVPEFTVRRSVVHPHIRRAIELFEDKKRLRHDLEYFVAE